MVRAIESTANRGTGVLKESSASRLEVSEVVDVTLAQAGEIAAMFEAALGPDGVDAPGHEPYPDPSLFSAEGVLETVKSPYRRLFVARLEGMPVGGIIADSLHDFACEFNCMAVDKRYRGRGIGNAVVAGATRRLNDSFFLANVTELVTHSLASQVAHIKQGFENFLGFGYSHYPHVFFPDRPESVLWSGQLLGRLCDYLKEWRLCQSVEVKALSESERLIASELLKTRTIFLPAEYEAIGREIVGQFSNWLDYRIQVPRAQGETLASVTRHVEVDADGFDVDIKPEYAHTYIDFGFGFDIGSNGSRVEDALEKIKKIPGKRFIRATLKANHPSSVAIADFLRDRGFVFHSILPLYQYFNREGGHGFLDLLGLQWISPDTVSANPLPGETRSVIKLYGYPLGLPGRIIALIKSELAARGE